MWCFVAIKYFMYIARASVKLLHLHILQANCINSTAEPAKVFAGEVKKLQLEKMKPQEQITLEPYERNHAVVIEVYQWVIISNFVHIGMLLLAVFCLLVVQSKKRKLLHHNYCITCTSIHNHMLTHIAIHCSIIIFT